MTSCSAASEKPKVVRKKVRPVANAAVAPVVYPSETSLAGSGLISQAAETPVDQAVVSGKQMAAKISLVTIQAFLCSDFA